MIAIKIDASGLQKMQKQLDAMIFKLPLAIMDGLNEGGDKVRTKVQHALQKQAGLVRYSSVTSRVRTARAFAGQADTSSVAKGSGVGQGMQYQIIVKGKPPTKPEEFKWRVQRGPGGGVTVNMWGVPHKFKRSFQIEGTGAAGLRMRIEKGRFPIRKFDGPNLAKEAVKDETARAFFDGVATLVVPIVEKRLARMLSK